MPLMGIKNLWRYATDSLRPVSAMVYLRRLPLSELLKENLLGPTWRLYPIQGK